MPDRPSDDRLALPRIEVIEESLERFVARVERALTVPATEDNNHGSGPAPLNQRPASALPESAGTANGRTAPALQAASRVHRHERPGGAYQERRSGHGLCDTRGGACRRRTRGHNSLRRPLRGGDAADWRASLRQPAHLVQVPEASAMPLDGTLHARASYLAYEWLKQQPPFDVIQFPEINGVGFYSLQAKRLGLAFHQTYCCVVLHSPTLWHRTENREHVDREEDLALDFIERESVARADALVSPTNYLLSWASRWGFRFPHEVYVQPYVSHAARASSSDRPSCSELVFFGRLESRKGIELFCDALDLLARVERSQGTPVTFLGKIGRVGLEDGATFARRRSDGCGVPVRLETALGQEEALDYLRGRPAVAVMPSLADNMPYTVLECLAEGIPFISTTTGGIPEMVASEDHATVLAAPEPSALADVIERALRQGLAPARGSADPDTVRREWIAWHELLAARESSPAPPTARPLVSVCIATRNRPELLARHSTRFARRPTRPSRSCWSTTRAIARRRSRCSSGCSRSSPPAVGRSSAGRCGHIRAATRNAAAAHAHGEYLLFMDDDNLARPHEVETFVAAALHSGVPILTCVVDHFRDEPGTNGAPTPTMRWLPLGPALTVGILWNRFGDTNMLFVGIRSSGSADSMRTGRGLRRGLDLSDACGAGRRRDGGRAGAALLVSSLGECERSATAAPPSLSIVGCVLTSMGSRPIGARCCCMPQDFTHGSRSIRVLPGLTTLVPGTGAAVRPRS